MNLQPFHRIGPKFLPIFPRLPSSHVHTSRVGNTKLLRLVFIKKENYSFLQFGSRKIVSISHETFPSNLGLLYLKLSLTLFIIVLNRFKSTVARLLLLSAAFVRPFLSPKTRQRETTKAGARNATKTVNSDRQKVARKRKVLTSSRLIAFFRPLFIRRRTAQCCLLFLSIVVSFTQG